MSRHGVDQGTGAAVSYPHSAFSDQLLNEFAVWVIGRFKGTLFSEPQAKDEENFLAECG